LNSDTYQIKGGYSTSVEDYTDLNVFDSFYTAGGQALLSIVDPFSYREEMTMPKLIFSSTGDQFFLPDGARFYLDEMAGKNYITYMPNTDHGLDLETNPYAIVDPLMAFYKAMIDGATLPAFSWDVEDAETVRVTTVTAPTAVTLWQAHTTLPSRDFRLETLGAAWQSTPLTADSPGEYVAHVDTPRTGWTAFFVQLKFQSLVTDMPYTFSTPMQVIPDTYPEPVDAK
jgi:PhoPQ-activated pathogenicity-related protein